VGAHARQARPLPLKSARLIMTVLLYLEMSEAQIEAVINAIESNSKNASGKNLMSFYWPTFFNKSPVWALFTLLYIFPPTNNWRRY